MAIDCTNNGVISARASHSGSIINKSVAYWNVDHSSATEQCLTAVGSALRVYILSNTIKVFVNAGVDGTYTTGDITSYLRTDGVNQLYYSHLPYLGGTYYAPDIWLNGVLLSISVTTSPSGTMSTFASQKWSVGSRIDGTLPLATGGIIEEAADIYNSLSVSSNQIRAITSSGVKGEIKNILTSNTGAIPTLYSYCGFHETNLDNEIFATYERTQADGNLVENFTAVGGATQAICLESTADAYYIEAGEDDDKAVNWNSNALPSFDRDYPIVGLKKWLQYASLGGLSFTSAVYIALFKGYCSQTLSGTTKQTTAASYSGYIPREDFGGGGCYLVAPTAIGKDEEVRVYYFALDIFYQKGKMVDEINKNDFLIIPNVNQSIYGRLSKMRSI